jgi:hypothetical protein
MKLIALAGLSILGLSILISSPFAFASNESVHLDLTLSQNGQMVSHPTMNVELDQSGTWIQQEIANSALPQYQVDVVPTLAANNAVKLSFKISQIVNGKKVLVSSPSVVVSEGESAKISQAGNGTDLFEFSVTPKLN